MDDREEALRQITIDLDKAGFTRICGFTLEDAEADLAAYLSLLEGGPSELDLQRFLTSRPRNFLGERGSQCRWVKAHPYLGNQFMPDFLTVRIDSNPLIRWTLVEIQRPDAGLFTQDRRKRTTEQFDEGMRQIIEWRDWLSENSDYAQKARARQGLGLTGLTAQADGLILIGRRRKNLTCEECKLIASFT
ncbi:Shedu anti-phage system protein SduA domain-containing protein [Actinoplanes sp. CA-030573]|uniref:Shedu anti-phage system protein SduA domain-containing protein n=1 Tax=Actinoplanes sp. CA-030573 TaxID=3239898 RepID=UPI003D8E9076